MCIQMNYNDSPNVLMKFDYHYHHSYDEDQNDVLYTDNYNPIHVYTGEFEYLQLLDYMRLHSVNNEYYDNINYVLGICASLYGIYYIVKEMVQNIRMKYM